MQIHPMGLGRATDYISSALKFAGWGSTNSRGYYEINMILLKITTVAGGFWRDGD
jgi:hypothetical protein